MSLHIYRTSQTTSFFTTIFLCAVGHYGNSIDSRNFGDVRRQKSFVDKTLWLREFWNDGMEHLYLTAPSRFGKTTLLSMMVEFFDKNQRERGDSDSKRRNASTKGVFEGTKILEQESEFFQTHFRKHVILFLDFAPLQAATNVASTQRILCGIYSKARHDVDLEENWKSGDEKIASISRFTAECKVNYTGFLVTLPSDVKQLHSKFNDSALIVLIDDVDRVISSLIYLNTRQDTIDCIMTIVGGFLHRLLGNHKFIGIRKYLIVGSMYLPGTLTLSSPKHEVWRNFNSVEKYAKYLGLTDKEVEELLVKFAEPPDRISDLENYYGGFTVRNSKTRIFNTGSVIAYFASSKLDYYWPSHDNPVENEFSKVISRPSLGSIIEQLIIGGRVHVPPEDSEGGIFFKTLKKMRDTPSVLDDTSEKVAANSFISYLENIGYLSRSYATNTLHASNKETAHALGQTLVQKSDYYENNYNLSRDTIEEYVDAFMALTVEDPEYSIFKLAAKIYKIYASFSSETLALNKRLNIGGPLYALLAYSDHKNLTNIIGEEVVSSENMPTSSECIWSRDGVFWGTPLTYGMPELAIVRNDMVGILANFKRGNSSAFALKQLYNKRYHKQFPRKLGTYNLEGKIYMGINVDDEFNVLIYYFSSSHTIIDFVEYPPS